MIIDEGLIDYNSDDVNKSLKNHYKKKYRLSITLGDKSYVCNNINDEDIIIKEFEHYDQASNYIDNNFTKIKEGWNYNYYIKKSTSERAEGIIWQEITVKI